MAGVFGAGDCDRYGWGHSLAPSPESTAPVLGGLSGGGGVTSAVTLSGTIRRAHVVGVSAPVPGYIDVLPANVGEEVYAGQELARIGNAGLESDRAQATATVA